MYEQLEVLVTLRCNASCRNCLRLCNMDDWTGLGHLGPDMTDEEFSLVVSDVLKLHQATGEPALRSMSLTGGEPFLHPLIEKWAHIVVKRLLVPGVISHFHINTNLSCPIPPSLAPYSKNFLTLGEQKANGHVAMFDDPAERGEALTRDECSHYRKDRLVASRYGYTRCCAGEGYVRLFAAEHLMLPFLPLRMEDWPEMDEICHHCAFASPTARYERDVGRPISGVYEQQASLNRAGRVIRARLGSRLAG